jgi:hypothetical protein
VSGGVKGGFERPCGDVEGECVGAQSVWYAKCVGTSLVGMVLRGFRRNKFYGIQGG